YRSNNLLLLEVSCPVDEKRLLTLYCSAVTFVFNCLLSLPHDGCHLFLDALLLLCGDVELNPGPTDMEKLSKLIENLASTNDKYQNETCERLSGISSGIDELKQKVATLEKQMQEINGIKERLAVVESSLHEVQGEVVHSHDKIDALDSGIDDLNNRMRRNNLLFRGIPDKQNETWEETACHIKEFVNNHLVIETGEIERAHRVGQKRGVTARPIVVRVLDYRNRQNVLNN
ncbi:unnamed protein product, partial [Ixodes hexagonus]